VEENKTPVSAAQLGAESSAPPYAGLLRRLVAYFLDSMLVMLLTAAVAFRIAVG
jgi:hypothetical protein